MIVAAHQPNFLPNLSFVHKLKNCDIFVIRDDVDFSKGDFHHRNRIRCNSHDNLNDPKSQWLTLPVEKRGLIREIRITNSCFLEKILQKIEKAYKNTTFFSNYFGGLETVFCRQWRFLIDLNLALLEWLRNISKAKANFVLASSLNVVREEKSADLYQMCCKLGATVYLSGVGAKVYMDATRFKDVMVKYSDFQELPYKQTWPGFVPNMSFLEKLFNEDILCL